MHRIFVVCAVVLLAAGPAPAADFCVAKGGADSNLGTYPADPPDAPQDQCWSTLGRAIDEARAGDTVCLMTGTWEGPVEFPHSGNNEEQRIVWRACQGQSPEINQPPTLADTSAVRITGSYQTFTGLRTEVTYGGEDDDDFEIIWWIGGDHVVLDGVEISGVNAVGKELGGDHHHGEPCRLQCTDKVIFISVRDGAEYTDIRNCVVRHISKHGIAVQAAAFHTRIANNLIYDAADRTIDIGSCRRPNCGTYPNYKIRDVLIEDNILCGVWREDFIQTNEDSRVGDQDPLSSPGVVIRNNLMCSANENGADMKGGSKWLIEGNLLYGMVQGAVVMRGSNTQADQAIARNNIIFDSGSGAVVLRRSSVYNNTTLHNRRHFAYPEDPEGTPSGCGIDTPYPYSFTADIVVGAGELLNNACGDAVLAVNLQRYGSVDRIDGNIYWNGIEGEVRFTSKNELDLRDVDFAGWRSRLAAEGVEGWDENAEELGDVSDFFSDPTGLSGICCPYCLGTVDDTDPANVWDDALLTYHQQFDFSPKEKFRNAGVNLTETVGSGSGTVLRVVSATGFYDGTWAPTHTQGDLIVIGDLTSGTLARVVGRNLADRTLTLDRSVTWSGGQPVNVVYETNDSNTPVSTSRNQGAFHYYGKGMEPRECGGVCCASGQECEGGTMITASDCGACCTSGGTCEAVVTETIFSSLPYYGDRQNWQEANPERWMVAMDGGDLRYHLASTDHTSTNLLGEYSLVRDRSFGDFTFTMRARTAENLSSNTRADFGIVFAYENRDSYCYAQLSSRPEDNLLSCVDAGVRNDLFVFEVEDDALIVDNTYHEVQLVRSGTRVELSVDTNGALTTVLAWDDAALGAVGRIGLNTQNDEAFFDDMLIEGGCESGTADCNDDGTDGCETDITSDGEHCGGCGNVCAAADHAHAGCSAGQCALECADGWSDCNGTMDDGCETKGACSVEPPVIGFSCRASAEPSFATVLWLSVAALAARRGRRSRCRS